MLRSDRKIGTPKPAALWPPASEALGLAHDACRHPCQKNVPTPLVEDLLISGQAPCATPCGRRGGLSKVSLFVLAPETVWNPSALEFPTAPRKILQRGALLPRREFTWALLVRLFLEMQVLRFMMALLPFVLAILIWPDMALPISQAPLFMLIAIGFVELRVLRISPQKRESVTTEADAARALETLNFRGRRVLTRVAAHRGLKSGTLFLVAEQSELARVPPLTVVSVQADSGRHRLVPLGEAERQIIREGLFDAEFSEADLLKANLREDVPMRSVMFDARGVSSHARLAAFLERPPAEGVAPA